MALIPVSRHVPVTEKKLAIMGRESRSAVWSLSRTDGSAYAKEV